MLDDTLPFDELDPCCQKEIEDERNRAAVGRRLRKFDKLNQRHDSVKSVFRNISEYKTCGCCSLQSVDYPMLARVRGQLDCKPETEGSKDNTDCYNEENNDDDDDDDEMWAGLEFDTLTPLEEERLLGMKERKELVEAATMMGFASHIEDSIGHINDMILQGRVVIIHFAAINLRVCALIDYALEGLAAKYLGTIFRRVRISDESDAFREKWKINTNTNGNGNQSRGGNGPCISVFSMGSLKACVFDLNQFGEGENENTIIYSNELEKHLEHLGGLHVTLSAILCQQSSTQYSEVEEGSDDERFESYCDTPGCGRFFPHEHVGGSGQLRGTGTLSGAAGADKGAEALGKDWCYKV